MTTSEPSALEPVKPPRSVWVWVLAGVSALLLLAAGALGFSYVGSRDSHEQQSAELTARIDELTPIVDRLMEEESDLNREYGELVEELNGTRMELAGMLACTRAIEAWLATDPEEPERPAATRFMLDVCRPA